MSLASQGDTTSRVATFTGTAQMEVIYLQGDYFYGPASNGRSYVRGSYVYGPSRGCLTKTN